MDLWWPGHLAGTLLCSAGNGVLCVCIESRCSSASSSPAPAPAALPFQQAGSTLPRGFSSGPMFTPPFIWGEVGRQRENFKQAFLSQSSLKNITVSEMDEEEQTTRVLGTQTPRQSQTDSQPHPGHMTPAANQRAGLPAVSQPGGMAVWQQAGDPATAP